MYKKFLDGLTGEIANGVLWVDDDGKTTTIPADDGNNEWRAYRAWLAKGNTPVDADPVSIEAARGKAMPTTDEKLDALIEGGQKLADVKAKIQAAKELNQAPKPKAKAAR